MHWHVRPLPAVLAALLACGEPGDSTSSASGTSTTQSTTSTASTSTGTTSTSGQTTSTSTSDPTSTSSTSTTSTSSTSGPSTTSDSSSTSGTTGSTTGTTGTTGGSTTGSSTTGSSTTGNVCQGDMDSCAGGEACCPGLFCCEGVPVPPGKEFCAAQCPDSDRNVKTDIRPIDVDDILARVVALDISTWRYKKDPADVRHLGPMAQDFRAAFGLWDTDRMIFPLDATGVSMAAIQGLHRRLQAAEAEGDALRARLEQLERRLADLETR